MELGDDERDLEGVHDIWVAAPSRLSAMTPYSVYISSTYEVEVSLGVVFG